MGPPALFLALNVTELLRPKQGYEFMLNRCMKGNVTCVDTTVVKWFFQQYLGFGNINTIKIMEKNTVLFVLRDAVQTLCIDLRETINSFLVLLYD